MKNRGLSCGQFKLRGKLTKKLGCGCCVVENYKWKHLFKNALKDGWDG